MTPFAAALQRRLDPGSRAPLAVALSGGGDSLALLHLTLDWAQAHGRPVLALTVDHGLNPDSAAWTTAAGAKARALGADWRALAWEGPKPTTGVQARARAARHALLAEAARAAGARVLLMGHTADDIAEGEAMRAADTPGLGRLREWSPSPAWPEGRGVFLLRPMLQVRRTDLRAFLDARGADWLDDPANADPRFARVRARQALAGGVATPSPATDLDPAVPALAHRLSFTAAGAEAPRAVLAAAPGPVLKPVLAAALLSVAGGSRPPRGPELERLIGVIAAGGVATLAGARLDARTERIHIARALPRRGAAPAPKGPWSWAGDRFAAACGLLPDEASIQALPD